MADPLLPPLQLTFDCTVAVTIPVPILLMIATAVFVQFWASVMVTVYEPAAKPEVLEPVAPGEDQLYISVPPPPAAFTVTLPLEIPHVAGEEDMLAVIPGGSVIVTALELVHPVASVIVTL